MWAWEGLWPFSVFFPYLNYTDLELKKKKPPSGFITFLNSLLFAIKGTSEQNTLPQPPRNPEMHPLLHYQLALVGSWKVKDSWHKPTFRVPKLESRLFMILSVQRAHTKHIQSPSRDELSSDCKGGWTKTTSLHQHHLISVTDFSCCEFSEFSLSSSPSVWVFISLCVLFIDFGKLEEDFYLMYI